MHFVLGVRNLEWPTRNDSRHDRRRGSSAPDNGVCIQARSDTVRFQIVFGTAFFPRGRLRNFVPSRRTLPPEKYCFESTRKECDRRRFLGNFIEKLARIEGAKRSFGVYTCEINVEISLVHDTASTSRFTDRSVLKIRSRTCS